MRKKPDVGATRDIGNDCTWERPFNKLGSGDLMVDIDEPIHVDGTYTTIRTLAGEGRMVELFVRGRPSERQGVPAHQNPIR